MYSYYTWRYCYSQNKRVQQVQTFDSRDYWVSRLSFIFLRLHHCVCWVASWPHLSTSFPLKFMRVFFRRLSLHQQRLISMMKWGIFMNPARSGHQSEHTHTRFFFIYVIWIKNVGIWKRRNCWTNQTSSYCLPPNHTQKKKKKNVRWRYWFKYSRNLLCNLGRSWSRRACQ